MTATATVLSKTMHNAICRQTISFKRCWVVFIFYHADIQEDCQFFVVLEQVSKCLVFLRNVRLGIDKLINVYQNHQTQALRLSTWNTKQCMEGSLFVINLFFFKATKNCVFQYHQLKFRGFFIITNQIINIPQAVIEGFNSSLARNVHFWGITN